MEETQRSKLLIAGEKDCCLKGVKALFEHFCQHATDDWQRELAAIDAGDGSVNPGGARLIKLNELLTVQNKYFRADLEVHLLVDADHSETHPLEEYEGLITFVNRTLLDLKNSWLISGSCDDLQLRITVVNSNKELNLEDHFESLESYTETVIEDLDNIKHSFDQKSSLTHPDSQGIERVIEAIKEGMWEHNTPLPKAQGYKQMKDDTDSDHNEQPDNLKIDPEKNSPSKQEPETKKEIPEKISKDAEEFFKEEEFDEDMKIFEELMAFKAISGGLSHDQRKKMADKLMSKFANMFGDDI